jgi:hypothetical protein
VTTEPTNPEVAEAFRRLADLVEDIVVPTLYRYLPLWGVHRTDDLVALIRAAHLHGATVANDPAECLKQGMYRVELEIGAVTATVLTTRDALTECAPLLESAA